MTNEKHLGRPADDRRGHRDGRTHLCHGRGQPGVWERDYSRGRLQEPELFVAAQDNDENTKLFG